MVIKYNSIVLISITINIDDKTKLRLAYPQNNFDRVKVVNNLLIDVTHLQTDGHSPL